MTKTEGETDWDYMKRKTPKAYDALDRVPSKWDVMEALFDKRTTFWHGNDNVDLTNKAYLGLLQLEVEAIAAHVQKVEESVEGLADRKGWRLMLRAKGNLLYQSPLGEVVAVPMELADVLARGHAFEGKVTPHGKYLRFVVGEDTLADLPRSLVFQLRGSEPGIEGGESGGDLGEGGE